MNDGIGTDDGAGGEAGRGTRRMVVLLHTLPSGDSHFDWLIQTSMDAEAPVMTFRTRVNPANGVVFSAERIGDHRAMYLTHEGAVSGGRGVVKRVWECAVARVEVGKGSVVVEGGGVEFEGREIGGGMWGFERGREADKGSKAAHLHSGT